MTLRELLAALEGKPLDSVIWLDGCDCVGELYQVTELPGCINLERINGEMQHERSVESLRIKAANEHP